MTNFLRYLFQEVESQRLSKPEALNLVRQFEQLRKSGQINSFDCCVDENGQGLEIILENSVNSSKENALDRAQEGYSSTEDSSVVKKSFPDASSSNLEEAYELMTFVECWEAHPLETIEGTTINSLLCFASEPVTQKVIAEFVQSRNSKAKVVFISQITSNAVGNNEENKRSDFQNRYLVSYEDTSSYNEAFLSIQEDLGEVDAILYLWALEEQACIKDMKGVVYALQALSKSKLVAKRFLLAGQWCDNLENELSTSKSNAWTLERCYLESWIGFERSLGMLFPDAQVTNIYRSESAGQKVDTVRNIHKWMEILWTELQQHAAGNVLYRTQLRECPRFISNVKPVKLNENEEQSQLVKWRKYGTYLITGGVGGLGLLFAKHIARTQSANLILVGRSALDKSKQNKIDAIRNLDVQVEYIRADVGDIEALRRGIDLAKERLGDIHGVIHAAGVEGNKSVIENNIHIFQTVLSPKISGTLALDEVLRDEPLDFVCYFSSSAAILGDFGSCDYSIGNRFQMAYANYRQELVNQGLLHGKTLVINWPLWKEGGMGVDSKDFSKMYLSSSGQRFLEAEEGIMLFEKLLHCNTTQCLVLAGFPSRIKRFLASVISSKNQLTLLESESPLVVADTEANALAKGRRVEMKGLTIPQCIEWDLKQLTSDLLKIPRTNIHIDDNLADFGFDSISLAKFSRAISSHFGIEITPAIFFGYPTLQLLAEYLEEQYAEELKAFYREKSPIVPQRQNVPILNQVPKTNTRARLFLKRSTVASETPENISEPIAIIGMSGRFPQARTVDEMWALLIGGKEGITEIPPERFDWHRYYGDPQKGTLNQKQLKALNCKWTGCIPDVAEFDPLFFEISPREAIGMDPRQRLLLQESWKALEDAGYGPAQINTHNIGMFVGVETGDYSLLAEQSADGDGGITANHEAILAARLSYVLNLSGPNMAINTACSSGLVAAHQACMSLRNRECDTALAAGVNIMFTPYPYLGMSQAGMLSEDGKCYTFDQRANGLVPGEAVAVVVLKRLSQATQEGDPIDAVVIGSGVNYDGKTNGITAPSGVAQTRLLKDVYDRYRINPESIEYIVAHGTGTKLGDPIEINALYDAFKGYTQKQGYCALTSTKTNFGHTFAASGLVSLISLVQAMRHETIPASLHCEQENDYINWSESPFYVNKAAKSWPAQENKPRLGAVSAFGMSGTNAHMVVRSYDQANNRSMSEAEAPYYLLVLSAKTEEALQVKIDDMVAWLQQPEHAQESLASIGYTLLEGRQQFKYRYAIVIQDQEDVLYVWKQAGGKENLRNMFKGVVAREFTEQKALRDYAQDLVERSYSQRSDKKRYQETLCALADVYCQGYTLDWQDLFDSAERHFTHLPTYPFARELYWVTPSDSVLDKKGKKNEKTGAITQLHPLLHQNTSTLSEQRFSSAFDGEEFFADQEVDGKQVLPSVIYLEMARAAVAKATGGSDSQPLQLSNVVWGQSIILNEQENSIHIGLYAADETSLDEDSRIDFEIYSELDGDTDSLVHGRGQVVVRDMAADVDLDLKALKDQCSQTEFGAEKAYDLLGSLGMKFGSELSCLGKIFVGEEQGLAKVTLSDGELDAANDFVLHPSLLMAMLQASIVLQSIANGSGSLLVLPSALKELYIHHPCSANLWVWIRFKSKNTENNTPSIDIDICDDAGKVCVQLVGLTLQAFDSVSQTPTSITTLPLPSVNQEDFELLTFEERWVAQPIDQTPTQKSSDVLTIETFVCFASLPRTQQAITDFLKSTNPYARVIFISHVDEPSGNERLSTDSYIVDYEEKSSYEKAFLSIQAAAATVDAVLYLWALEEPGCIKDVKGIVYGLQALATSKLSAKRVILAGQWFEGHNLEQCYLESWIGFERSLGLLFPDTDVAVIYHTVSPTQTPALANDTWMQTLWAELQVEKPRSILYRAGTRYVYKVAPSALNDTTTSPVALRQNGTYLITGGCGGLGLLFATHLTKAYSVNLVLTGRSVLDENKQKNLQTLESLGGQVLYLQADVCDLEAMRSGLADAKAKFGTLHGVLHAAGLEESRSLLDMTFEDFKRLLDPKITGTLVLDELLQNEPLDFICYFSSSSAVLGDFGNCNYAIGNRFLMPYAQYRDQRVKQGECHGKSVVINWPLWREGGMGVESEDFTKMYLQSSGQRFLEADEGVAIFERLLQQEALQHLVVVGRPSRVRRFLGLTPPPTALELESPLLSVPEALSAGKGRRSEMKGFTLLQCIEWDLKELTSRLLKIPRDRLHVEDNLVEFGFDSISLAQFARSLSAHYDLKVTPALFFGHPTLQLLTDYFHEQYTKVMEAFYREDSKVSPMVEKIQKAPVANAVLKRLDRAKSRFSITRAKTTGVDEPIAIIGMSGRFPQARTVDEMWTILIEGKEAVTEIPPDRFDWQRYYGAPQEGKINCKWSGSLPGVAEFDPLFFEISPREAISMDPRQRLLLQESWKALEDAGYGATQINTHKIGMFVGVETGDYGVLAAQAGEESGGVTANHEGILAARLSYVLNLSGPNMAINTACSSGLVAAHQACLSLRAGECDTAIAAGVNILFRPESYVAMSEAGMLSEEGKCYTFDHRANGMVPGEAVAVVVFKRLSQAQAEGDSIYAVIAGSGVNYDGKTNGITAPSGVAQARLLKEVYDHYRIDPETIEYIVAHGTGTKLGDPIEINALYDAFKGYTRKQGYCALTSTKTNFGHTFAASGLVSLISLVESMRHETIPASLHCEQENDYINWSESPFYVNKAAKSWPAQESKPRLGAVSAFGMSGTNAHMVVRSYDQAKNRFMPEAEAPYYLLVLSAKTEEALQAKIDDMVAWLQQPERAQESLASISYTLLEGRQQFKYRCAIVIQDQEDALYVWKQAGGKEKLRNMFKGVVAREFTKQKALRDYAQGLVTHSNSQRHDKNLYQQTLYALADVYCQGYTLDWKDLFESVERYFVHLPTYPFAKERYWIEMKNGELKVENGDSISKLHPLVHQNTSTLTEQRFSSIFNRQDSFIDQQLQGETILSGMAYLEMVCAAVAKASDIEDNVSFQLSNMVWAQPVVINEQSCTVHISLYPAAASRIDYEIYSKTASTADPFVHGQGQVIIGDRALALVLDLVELRGQCQQAQLSGEDAYRLLRTMGMKYGAAYLCLSDVFVGENQLLAAIRLSSSMAERLNQCSVHPSLLEAAVQAAIVGKVCQKSMNKPVLPCSLTSLHFYQPCNAVMWASIHYLQGNASDSSITLDIDLCDDSGRLCVQLKGLALRELDGPIGVMKLSQRGTLMVQPQWRRQAVEVSEVVENQKWDAHHILLCEPGEGLEEQLSRQLQMQFKDVQCLSLQCEHVELSARYSAYALQVFERLKTILSSKPKAPVLVQIVIPNSDPIEREEKSVFSGLSGLLRTAHQENPKLVGQLIETESNTTKVGKLIEHLAENRYLSTPPHIRYRDHEREVLEWQEVDYALENSEQIEPLPWKDEGIYLITGGAGGLGLLFANDIAQKANKTTLILTGRSPLNEAKTAQLGQLESRCAKVEYRQVDMADPSAVTELLNDIEKTYGGVNGIVHSAGVIQDNFILNKTSEEVSGVLAPKVSGLVNLDQASREMRLDFLVVFSSMSGALGNAGQADYAAANAFMDAYVRYRNHLVTEGKRQGRAVSINWPLWKTGGMHMDAQTEQSMVESTGMIALQRDTGIKAFYQILAQPGDHWMVMEGNLAIMRERVLGYGHLLQRDTHETTDSDLTKDIDRERVYEKTLYGFRRLFGKVVKLDVERIEPDEPLEQYGIDSIMITQLNRQLGEVFGELSKTLFYEYQTLAELTEYFLDEHLSACIQWTGLDSATIDQQPTPATTLTTSSCIPILTSFKTSKLKTSNNTTAMSRLSLMEDCRAAREPIAIIGISGCYPQAKNLEEFWQNLVAGKNCISEIPEDRWSTESFFVEEVQAAVEQSKSYSKWGGFIEEFSEFDPLFFGISPREAMSMDPQERLFLESSWHTFEDAGYTRERLAQQHKGRVGVFAGITKTGFDLYGPDLWRQGEKIFPHTSFSSVANRLSYFMDLNGPSMPIDTMCSSSLTAIHEACEYLNRGDCELAVAGGVNLYVHPSSYILLCALQMLSVDGKCKSFGDGGNGFVPGEGVGTVLLKPLSSAEADNDHIYATIRATGINHGGKTNGYTVPSPIAHSELIRDTIKKAGLNARSISYIEAHGTGTKLGDPIEVTGLTQAFKPDTQDTQFCALGSAKSNIGHLEAAAGIAGLTKVILQMQHHQLVPSLHARKLNPNINFEKTPFVIQQELSEWKQPQFEVNGENREYKRIAGISSFGAGGANAHVIVEEYLPSGLAQTTNRVDNQHPALVVLSAKTDNQLIVYAQQILEYIRNHSEVNVVDLVYTLQTGREAMEERMGVLVDSIEMLIEKLQHFVSRKKDIEDLYRGKVAQNKEVLALFSTDEKLAEIFAYWIKSGQHTKVLNFWVRGQKFDWNQLYGDFKPNRISLPGYPFAKKRYWVPVADPQVDRLKENRLKEKNASLETAKISENMDIPRSEETKKSQNNKKIQNKERISLMEFSPPQSTSNNKADVFGKGQSSRTFNTLKEELRGSLAEVLYMEPHDVGEDEQFMELGMNSIVGVEWIQMLNRQFGVSAAVNRVYEYPTLREFTEYLGELLQVDRLKEISLKEKSVSLETAAQISKEGRGANAEKMVDNRNRGKISLLEVSPLHSILDGKADGEEQVPKTLNTLQEELRRSLAEVLYMEAHEVSEDEQFMELGMNSIVGVEWIQMLNRQYGVSIAVNRVYEYPTLREFTEYLGELLQVDRLKEISLKEKSVFLEAAAKAHEMNRVPNSEGMMEYRNKEKISLVGSSPPCSFLDDKTGVEEQGSKALDAMQEELRISLADVLYMEPHEVNEDEQFIEMGMNSIVGVEWVQILNRQYGVSIPVNRVYEYSTLREFTFYLYKEMGGAEALSKSSLTKLNDDFTSQENTLKGGYNGKISLPIISFPDRELDDKSEPIDNRQISFAQDFYQDKVDTLQKELRESLAEVLYMEPGEVGNDDSFMDLGMNSIVGVEWIQIVNRKYGASIAVNTVYDYPTLGKFTGYLKSRLRTEG